MTALERPPSEVFCLTCGPEEVLERNPAAPLLRCASCGAVTEVPTQPKGRAGRKAFTLRPGSDAQ